MSNITSLATHIYSSTYQNATEISPVIRTSSLVKVTFCIMFSILSLCIVLGNIMVISVFLYKRKLRTRTAYFLTSLALSDIIVGSVGVPSFIYVVAKSVEFPSFVYILWNTVDVLGATASIWHLMMITIERFYAIGWPFLHRASSKKTVFLRHLLSLECIGSIVQHYCKNSIELALLHAFHLRCVFYLAFIGNYYCLHSHVCHCIKECFSKPPASAQGRKGSPYR